MGSRQAETAIERAERRAAEERLLAAEEAEKAVEEDALAAAAGSHGGVHLRAAELHRAAEQVHLQAAELQENHAEELRQRLHP